MKYYLSLGLTRDELMVMEDYFWRNPCGWVTGKIYHAVSEALRTCGAHRCPNCGKHWSDDTGAEGWTMACHECLDLQAELRAFSLAVERDRELMTGENDPAEPLEW